MSVQLSLLHIIYAFLMELDIHIINAYKYDFITLLNIMDYVVLVPFLHVQIWNTSNDSQVLQACLRIYSILFELCPTFLHIPAIVDRIRHCLICNDTELRCRRDAFFLL